MDRQGDNVSLCPRIMLSRSKGSKQLLNMIVCVRVCVCADKRVVISLFRLIVQFPNSV